MAKPAPEKNQTDPAQCKRRARAIAAVLRTVYPGSGTALAFGSPMQLLVATILSAQCTDERVNQVTPVLFREYPDAHALAEASLESIERIIRSTGFFHQKARSILACCQALVERYGGQVPESMEALTALPGVGRKTANLVRACAMGKPGLIVDTHFKRLVGRMGLTEQTNPDKIEYDLARLLPESDWTGFSNALIWHGRRVCTARKPGCPDCPVLAHCSFGRDSLGLKP